MGLSLGGAMVGRSDRATPPLCDIEKCCSSSAGAGRHRSGITLAGKPATSEPLHDVR
jgi:hypothetical protein